MKKILLDAGHGGTDPGAQASGVSEADVVSDIVVATGIVLERLVPDYEIVYTRIKDKAESLINRYYCIVDINPDVFVSVHCNAIADNPETFVNEQEHTDGYEIFYRDDNDIKLAKSIDQVMRRSDFWNRRRGIKQDQEWLGKRLTVLNSLTVPSVLVEVGFLTNTNERDMIVKNVCGIADILAHGIINFLIDDRT